MHHAFSRSLLLLPLPLAGCGGDSNGSPPAAIVSGTIGAEGGSLSVTSGALAGASITIPAGALTSPVAISFFEDTASLVPGFVDVGPAVRIEPDGLPLALPGVLTLPFDPTRVPPAVTAADFIVRMRLGDGRVFEEPARHVDQALGLVTVDALQLATWWVSVPDEIDTRAYLPLNSGDFYVYDSGLRLTVAETRVEPNFLGIPLIKLTFSTTFAFFSGMYLVDDAAGALSLAGEFEIGAENRQERLDGAALILEPVEPVGASSEVVYTFTGFVPFGGPVPVYTGIAHTTVSLVERTSIVTPVHTFEDVVLLQFDIERSDSRPRSTTSRFRLWLANGVGPVQVQDNDNPPVRLVSGVVGGRPIE